MSIEIVTKASYTEQVYGKLKFDITRQIIKPGEKIDINSLKSRFNVSQTPIREALLKLERDGLVIFKSNIGVEVIQLNEKNIRETCEMLSLLDCKAIELAIKLNHKKLTEELEYHIREHEESMLLDEKYWEHANQVHRVFYKYADNDLLSRMENQAHAFSDMMFSEYIKNQNHRRSGVRDHKKIYEGVKNNNTEEAVHAMREHWSNSIKELI